MRTTTTESDPCVEPGVRIGVAAGMRLNRFLARAGVASRRKCDDLIAAGSVTVNGSPPTGLGDRVDPSQDLVEVNGKVVKLPRECEYVLLHKAASTIVTRWDEQARQTIYDGLKGLMSKDKKVRRTAMEFFYGKGPAEVMSSRPTSPGIKKIAKDLKAATDHLKSLYSGRSELFQSGEANVDLLAKRDANIAEGERVVEVLHQQLRESMAASLRKIGRDDLADGLARLVVVRWMRRDPCDDVQLMDHDIPLVIMLTI